MGRGRAEFPLEDLELISIEASLPVYFQGQDMLIADLFCGSKMLKQAVYLRYRDYLGSRFDYIGIDLQCHDEQRLDNGRNLVTTVKRNLLLDMSIPVEDKSVDILHMHMPLLYPINEYDDPYNGKKFSYEDFTAEVKRVLKGKFLMSIDNAFLKSMFQPRHMHDNIDELIKNMNLELITANFSVDGHYHHHLSKFNIVSDDSIWYKAFSNEYAIPNLFLIFQAE